jgi:hypothetical protein
VVRFLDWFFRDRRTGRIVVGQWPNLWLWVFGAASLVEIAVGAAGPVGVGARLVATLFLVIWAADELLRGVNPWRRCLGAAVLAGLALRAIL